MEKFLFYYPIITSVAVVKQTLFWIREQRLAAGGLALLLPWKGEGVVGNRCHEREKLTAATSGPTCSLLL